MTQIQFVSFENEFCHLTSIDCLPSDKPELIKWNERYFKYDGHDNNHDTYIYFEVNCYELDK